MNISTQQTNQNTQTATFLRASTAHQKANVLSEKRRKPADYVLNYSNEGLGLEVWISQSGLIALGFKGKSVKAAFHYRFGNVEKAQEHIAGFVTKVEKDAADRAAEKAERKAKVRELVVGDVLIDSWGYEQTNVDYYQVIELVGKSSVVMQQIRGEKTHGSNGDSGKCVPVLNSFVGEPFTKKVTNGHWVRMNSYSSAHKKEYTLVDGVKVFSGDYWSSYA